VKSEKDCFLSCFIFLFYLLFHNIHLEGVVLPATTVAAEAPCHLYVILAMGARKGWPQVVAVVAARDVRMAKAPLPHKRAVAIAPPLDQFPTHSVIHLYPLQAVP
jgi:hypothetical protein